MLKTHISACLLTTALLAAPALAQTSTTTSPAPAASPAPVTSPAPAPAAPAGSKMDQGATTNMSPNANMSTGGGAMTSANFITRRDPGVFLASDLIGMDVRGADNEDIGEVGDVLIDRTGQAQAVVIDVGGFLGIGERHVAIPMQALQFRSREQAAVTTGSVSTAPAGTAGQTATTTTAPAQNQAAMDDDDDTPDMIVISMSKDQLKNAPKFEDDTRASRAGGAPATTMGGSAPATGTTTAPKQ